MIAVNAPLVWLQRDGIGAHYFRGIFGPLRAARAEVAGATDLLGNLAFYPRTLLGQAGSTWIAAGCCCSAARAALGDGARGGRRPARTGRPAAGDRVRWCRSPC